jgi:putative ABC transport system permease protein
VFKFALKALRARKLRAVLTGVAILLGTAMIAGTFILTDQVSGAFDDIFKKANQGTDVILTQKTAFDSQQQQPGPLPESLVATVNAVPGVAIAEGQIGGLGALVVDGKYVGPTTGAPPLVFSTPSDRFNSNTIVAGTFPAKHGDVAIDKGLADREKLTVGQKVGLTTRIGQQPVTITGIFKFGDANSIGGATLTAITLADAQDWYDRKGQVSTILVAADSGVSATDLASRITAAVPANVLVETGSDNASRQAGDINDNLGFLKQFLFVFALIALLVGAFIIFNVFSITVAQRIRELAMLRTVGASRWQLLRSVLAEAFIIGLVASIVGVGVGVLFAKGITQLFDAAGFGLPTTGLQIKPRTVLVPILVGTLVTVLAAFIPGLRATKIPPIAALRDGATLPRSRWSRFSPYVGGLFVVLGILSIVSGFASDGAVGQRIGAIAGGALLILVGVGMLIRFVIRPLARTLGWPLQKLAGNSARLGRENTMRNTSRTATTAAALMVGVGLVVFISVFVAGLKSSFIDALDNTLKSDLIIINDGFTPLPAGVVASSEAATGVASSLGVGFAEVRLDSGTTEQLSAVDPAGAVALVKFDWQNGGSDRLLGQLGTDGAIVERDFAKTHNLHTGTTFGITTLDGKKSRFRVLGEYRDPQLFTGFVVANAAYDTLVPDKDVGVLLVKFDNGVALNAGKASVEAALKASYPAAKVRTNQEYKDFVGKQINQILTIFYALLAFSIVISLFGVLITLLLAVYERTREIGMLRAIGTTRGQIRSIIFSESAITCAIGGIIGIAVGLLFGYLIARGLESEGIQFSVPVGTVITVFILAVIAGLIAAVAPARRAAKLQPLEALHYE